MPRSEKRVRVERGLYRAGRAYWACATAPGETQARWRRIGETGIQLARRERDKFAYELRTGHISPVRGVITVRQLYTQWSDRLDELEQAGELRPRTITSYKDGVRLHVLPSWGSRDIRSISPDDMVAWHERQRRTGASTWSIRARWMSLRGLFAYAARVGHIARNPCDVLEQRERPKPGRPRARYLNNSEIQALLRQTDGQTRLIVAVLIFSGIRASEILGLTWEDIDFTADVIRVRKQMSRNGKRTRLKTDAARRDVLLMAELARLLRKAKLAAPFSNDEDLVIGNGIGNTLGYTRLLRAFTTARISAGVVDATPHTCRHTFASILIDGGASVEYVSQQLGHSSTKTTWDIYVHLFRAREQAEAARKKLDGTYGHMFRAADSETGEG